MLNQWQWKQAIATILSASTLLVSTGGLVSCGNNTQEPESQDKIDQNNNQRINQSGNNQNYESDNEQNEEQDDNDNDNEQDGDDNN